MSESLDQDPNKVIVTISRVHKSSAQPGVDLYTVSIRNTVDNVREYCHDSEEVPGYLERSERENVLRLSKGYLHDIFCQNFKHVTVKMEEES